MVTTAEAQVVLGVSETLFYRHYRKPRLLNPAHWDGQKAFFWRDEVELILAEAKRTRNRLELGELVQGMEAAKILGIRFQHFFRSLHENLSPITVVGQRGLYYDRHEVEALRDLRATTVTSGEVQRRFGISNHALQHWVRKGILKPVSGPNVDGKPKYRFSREEVEACSYQPRGPKNRQ